MTKSLLYNLVKLYTPFICAIIAIIHGVCYFLEINTRGIYVLGELTGHSILVLLFILYYSRKMCKWYKFSVKILMLLHVSNILYYMGIIPPKSVIYVSLVLNILALMCWLIFITTRNMSKAIRSACMHSET